MEKVVRTQPEGWEPTKELSQFLEDGWTVKMCNSMRRCDGTEYLEYIITKKGKEERERIKEWFSQKEDIPCSIPPVKTPPLPRKSGEPKPIETVTGHRDSLKSGMVFECRDNMRFLIVERAGKLYAISYNGVVKIEDYNEDLTYPGEEWADVMYIWTPKRMPAWNDTKLLNTKEADWSRR